MNGDDVLYSTVGRARRGNTESTTGKSSPPGRRFRGQRVSSFVHGFGRGGEGMQHGDAGVKVAKKVSLCLEGRGRGPFGGFVRQVFQPQHGGEGSR